MNSSVLSGVITDQNLVTGCVCGQPVEFSALWLIVQDAECITGFFGFLRLVF